MKSFFENMVVRKKRTAPEATEAASNNSEKSVNQMSSGEYDAALRSNRSLRQQINASSAVRHVRSNLAALRSASRSPRSSTHLTNISNKHPLHFGSRLYSSQGVIATFVKTNPACF
jgi:hypothetical protein